MKKTTAAPARINQDQVTSSNTVEEFLRFEKLLSDLSAHFVVSMAPKEVEYSIDQALEKIRDFFQVDRVGLIKVLPEMKTWRILHAVWAAGIPPISIGLELPESVNPWAYNLLVRKEEVLAYAGEEEVPEASEADRETWRNWGIRSNMVIPILNGATVGYLIAMNSVRRRRVWPKPLIPRLRLLGEVLVNALERSRGQTDREDLLRFERLIADLSARFVNIPLQQIDREITLWLERITEFFQVERTTIGIFSEDGTKLKQAYQFRSAGIESAPEVLSREQAPWYLDQLVQGKTIVLETEKDLPPEALKEKELFRARNMKSLLSLPLLGPYKTLGSCALVSTRSERPWPAALVQRFQLITTVFANALTHQKMERDLRERLAEIERLKRELELENFVLREEVSDLSGQAEIVGQSQAIKSVLAMIKQVAGTESTVLIQGETGTGKELLARAIHRMSSRRDRSLVTVNCAALPPFLIESELFGREKGAYTGALTRMVGRFELAHQSTLFLDEISEIPLELQGKLLRVLESGTFERLGSTKTLQVDIRILAATNRDLEQAVREGKFRNDLFYRLNVFPIRVPPLRERLEDIPLLIWAFVEEYQKKIGKRIDRIHAKAMEELKAYSWPGNIRELRNVVERAMISCSGSTLIFPGLSGPVTEIPPKKDLEEIERSHILSVLKETNWRLMGKGGAAEILGMKRTTLQSKMKRLGLFRQK
jgi:formate hydrogenlyase transcriptional activator